MKTNLLYLVYEYDSSLFTHLFCENKSRPFLNCNGKCQLAKLEKERQEKKTARVLEQLQAEVLIYMPVKSTDLFTPKVAEQIASKCFFFEQDLHSFLLIARNDKPPQFFAMGFESLS